MHTVTSLPEVLFVFFSMAGYGFNGGAALILPRAKEDGTLAALTAANTSIAGASAAITALITKMLLMKKQTGAMGFDLTATMNGALSGLVSATAGCGLMEPWAGAVTGIVAAWVYLGSSHLLLRLRLDDAVDG